MGGKTEMSMENGLATFRPATNHPWIYMRTYGSVSSERGKWPFRVTFLLKVERSCGQTVKDRHDCSIVLCQLYLLDHQITSRRTSEIFLVFFGTPQVDPFVKFYCMFNALVRPNLKRWTGFDVLIIFGVKF